MSKKAPIIMIDDYIEHLKSSQPYNEEGTYKLWEGLKALSDGLNTVPPLFSLVVEKPIAGVIDGTNNRFTITNKPATSFFLTFNNGLLVDPSIYKIMENLVVFNTAPVVSHILVFVYQKVQ